MSRRRGGGIGRAILARLDQSAESSFGSEDEDLFNLLLIQEAYGPKPPPPARPVVDIGTTAAGVESIADVLDLINLWDYRIQQLGNSFAAQGPMWVAKDPAGFADWSNDWANLQARYSAARSSAERTVSLAHLNPLPNSEIGAQSDYDAIMKSVVQAYTGPGGMPNTKGDWADLVARLRAAGGAVEDNPPQPTAPDNAQAVLTSTQSVSLFDKLGGNVYSPILNKIGSTLGLDKLLSAGGAGTTPGTRPLSLGDTGKLLIVVATLGVGGVFAFKLFVTTSVKAAIGLAATLGAGYVAYEGVDKLQGVASGANAAIKASKLLNP